MVAGAACGCCPPRDALGQVYALPGGGVGLGEQNQSGTTTTPAVNCTPCRQIRSLDESERIAAIESKADRIQKNMTMFVMEPNSQQGLTDLARQAR